MAICVGCGLEVNNGLLEVNVCGDPVIPNTTTGGLQCDPDTESGCLKVVLNSTHAGCGLTAQSGNLAVKPCNEGGIICGDTLQPDTQCIYVDVQGQGNAACVDLATAQTTCPSPNCNGLVRTCDGLWAPPKLFGTYSFSLDQDFVANTPISNYLIDPAGNIPDMPGSVGDGFPGPGSDFIVTANPNYELMMHSYDFDTAASVCPIEYYGNTFSTFTISFDVRAGELWRFLLWERLAFTALANFTGPTTVAGSPLLGNGWILQATFYLDRRLDTGGPFLETVQMNDVSSLGAGRTRCEYMITAQRLQGAGAFTNNVTYGSRQYRLTMNSAHCRPNESSSNANGNGAIVSFGV